MDSVIYLLLGLSYFLIGLLIGEIVRLRRKVDSAEDGLGVPGRRLAESAVKGLKHS